MIASPKDKSINFNTASWNLEDLSGLFAKDMQTSAVLAAQTSNKRPKPTRRRPFMIRPIALL